MFLFGAECEGAKHVLWECPIVGRLKEASGDKYI